MKSGHAATFDMVLDHDFGWDDGLICGGSVSGLILPLAAEAADIWRKLTAVTQPVCWGVKKDFSIALVAESSDECRVTSDENAVSSVTCHSSLVTVSDWLYQETVSPLTALWIAGSGHVAQAVAPLALQLDFTVTVFDDRPELANHQFFPPEVQLQVGGWHELLKVPLPKSPAFGLIVTRGHQHDALVLSEWIHHPFVFLGMIGSRHKARIMRGAVRQTRLPGRRGHPGGQHP